jgi:hypothetical protein
VATKPKKQSSSRIINPRELLSFGLDNGTAAISDAELVSATKMGDDYRTFLACEEKRRKLKEQHVQKIDEARTSYFQMHKQRSRALQARALKVRAQKEEEARLKHEANYQRWAAKTGHRPSNLAGSETYLKCFGTDALKSGKKKRTHFEPATGTWELVGGVAKNESSPLKDERWRPGANGWRPGTVEKHAPNELGGLLGGKGCMLRYRPGHDRSHDAYVAEKTSMVPIVTKQRLWAVGNVERQREAGALGRIGTANLMSDPKLPTLVRPYTLSDANSRSYKPIVPRFARKKIRIAQHYTEDEINTIVDEDANRRNGRLRQQEYREELDVVGSLPKTKIAADKLSFREKVELFFKEMNRPDKLADIDHMLNIFDGREDRLAVMLQKKYGESPLLEPEKEDDEPQHGDDEDAASDGSSESGDFDDLRPAEEVVKTRLAYVTQRYGKSGPVRNGTAKTRWMQASW